ncbi:MAG: TlpA disulfide reductase family protein [Pirellulaceae bacterium]
MIRDCESASEPEQPQVSIQPKFGDKTSQRLRQRFLVWSVAIASSLTTTAAVTLVPSPAWAQEEPATTEKSAEEQKKEKRAEQERFAKEFNALLQKKDFKQAGEMLDAAIADDPHEARFVSMNLSLAVNQIRVDKSAGLARLKALKEDLLARDKLDTQSAMALSSIAMYLTNSSDAPLDENLEMLSTIEAKLEEASDLPGVTQAKRTVLTSKVRLLTSAGKPEDAKSLFDRLIEESRQAIDPEKSATISQLVSNVTLFESLLGAEYPAEAEELRAEAQALALNALSKDDAGYIDYITYYNLHAPLASRLASSDPMQAAQVYDDLEAKLDDLKERVDEATGKQLARYVGTIKSSRDRLQAALEREKLVGTNAPPLDATHFIGMPKTSMEDLKGKVVLLDFWAVWCGPCIATFPHLTEWHEKYSSKGLTIVGITKFYNYQWDDEAGRATSVRGESVAEEDELAMLEKFREAYGLHHGFAVLPKTSEYSQAFHVTGIPTAVLLDKEGKIRMIKVGSGEANAQALQAEIEALLGQ